MSERTPMDLALKCLSRQAYSRAKMTTRLGRAGFEESQIDECLKRLENWGYLNDREYGIARIATLQKRLKSRNYVAADLEAQGLSPDLIRQLLADFYPEAMEMYGRIYRIRYAHLSGQVAVDVIRSCPPGFHPGITAFHADLSGSV